MERAYPCALRAGDRRPSSISLKLATSSQDSSNLRFFFGAVRDHSTARVVNHQLVNSSERTLGDGSRTACALAASSAAQNSNLAGGCDARNISLRGSALCVSLSQSPPDLLRLHQLPLGCAQCRPIRMPISTRCTRAQNRRRGLRSAQCACARLARCVCTRRGRHPSSPRRRRRRLRDPLPKRASP